MRGFKLGILILALTRVRDLYGAVATYQPHIWIIREPFENHSRTFDYQTGSNITLVCEGERSLKWKVPESVNKNDCAVSRRKRRSDSKFSETLCKVGAEYHHTGRYTCCYQDLDCDDPRYSDSVYLYVNDKENPLLVEDDFVQVYENRPTVLPCRPTFSTLKPTLWNSYEEIAMGDDVSFDPTRGFILHRPDKTFDGLFECRVEEFEFDEYLTLTYHSRSNGLEPFINSSTKYPVENDTFSLNCSVKTPYGSHIRIEWYYPSGLSQAPELKNPYFRDCFMLNGKICRFNTQQLVVWMATPRHSGTYTCVVAVAGGLSYNVTKNVTVYDPEQKTYIRLSTDYPGPVERKQSEKVAFRIRVRVFPVSALFTYRWEKDARKLLMGPRHSYRVDDSTLYLNISNLTVKDSGVYTLFASSDKAEGNISITLRVIGRPLLRVEGNRTFYQWNSSYQLTCVAEDSSSLGWRWKGWNKSIDETEEWKDLSENVTGVVSVTEGEGSSRVELLAHRTGYLGCAASNVVGDSLLEVPFVVTDAEEGFQVETSDSRPVERQFFRMVCKASNFVYGRLEWRRESGPSLAGIREEENDTDISLVKSLLFDSPSWADQGNYTCLATRRSDYSLRQEKTQELRLTAIRKPSFVFTNLNGSELLLSAGSRHQFVCSVKGTPRPSLAWLKDQRMLNVSAIHGIRLEDNSQKLLIERLVVGDSGFYQCRAENAGGWLFGNITLLVAEEYTDGGKSRAVNVPVVVFVVAFGVGLVITAALLTKKIYKERKEKKELEILSQCVLLKGRAEQIDSDLPLDHQVELLPYDASWEFPRQRLKLGKTLGQGAFGRVVRAEATGIKEGEMSTVVAVKMLKERADSHQKKALMAELKILIHLRPHLNIVNLLGAVTENMAKGELMVVVEYCRYGNLRNYLLGRKRDFLDRMDSSTDGTDLSFPSSPSSPNSNYENLISPQSWTDSDGEKTFQYPLSGQTSCSGQGDRTALYKRKVSGRCRPLATSDLLYFTYQCAGGMQYLADRKLIHRDLAARNILVADHGLVKICDFGLAKDCYKYSNYVKKNNGPLPIKWMALESIRDKVFTTKSDVWSFGVLTWEIFSLGATPYPGMDLDAEFYKMLCNGFRMERPEYAPAELYETMKQCWNAQPDQRPTFSELSRRLESWVDEEDLRSYRELKKPYDRTDQYSSAEKTVPYINLLLSSSESNSSIHYDQPGRIRPVGDGPVPSTPMEVVPMIQLEVAIDNCAERDRESPGEGLLVDLSPQDRNSASDYICMKSPYSVSSLA